MTPPRLPRRLLGWILPAHVRAALLRDLDDEFVRSVVPARRAFSARWWYWRQALGSIAPALRLRHRASLLVTTTRDLRLGVRRLRREPGFALAVTATLSIGIGAATSVFALTHAVLLSDLPFPQPDGLVAISEIDTRRPSSGTVSYPDFHDYTARTTTLEAIAGYSGGSRTVFDANGGIDRVPMTEVTPGFFAMLGVRPALGREFTAGDTLAGAPPVVILTDAAWRRRFVADPSIVGRAIQMGDGQPVVIGVLPPAFVFPTRGATELWLPIRPTAAQRERRYMHWLTLVGRLAPGADVQAAQSDLTLIASRFAAVDPQYHPAARVSIETLHERVAGPVRPLLIVLQAAAAFLLLVACANVAGLLVARGVHRAHEFQVRAAIGAGRGRLVAQLLAESLALSLPGVIAGLALGAAAVRAGVSTLPAAQRAAIPYPDDIGLSPVMMLTAAGIAIATAVGFGVLPAWRTARLGSLGPLRTRSSPSPRDVRVQSIFVAAQLALALVLLTGAGLLGRSVIRLMNVSPGFDASNLLTFEVNGAEPKYSGADASIAMHDAMLERVGRLPGAAGVASISQPALGGRGNSGMFAVQSAPASGDVTTLIRTVSDGYFDVMRIPLVEGRRLNAADARASARVVVVNQTLARSVFGGRALGQRIAFPFFDNRPWWEIVGVVGDEQFVSIDREMAPVVYFPYRQVVSNNFAVVVRTTTQPEALTRAVRDVAGEIDPLLPVYRFDTMEQMLGRSDAVYRRRSALILIAVFAAAAVALAAIGLFGLHSHAVAARTREIGLRMALGADRRQVLGAVLARGIRVIAAGSCAGLGLAALASRWLAGLLFQIAAIDWLTFAASAGVVGVVGLAASFWPARRALVIDPAVALRRND